MGQMLYLGKQRRPDSETLGETIGLDPRDLLTHALIVGMTGSGKTGLGVVLIEELLRQGVPVIAIDPKGDLGNLLLLFEGLDAARFRPWIDEQAARRSGLSPEDAATRAADAWRAGLAEWGLDVGDVAALCAAREAVVYTPGSTSGVPLNVIEALDAPGVPFDEAAEELRDEISGIVTGLLGLVAIDADPLQSREAVFLAQLIETAWREGRALDLETLIGSVAEPPFDRIGALPVETVFPRREREGLMLALNNLLAAPSFEAWRVGEPLDVEAMLHTADGRPRLSIVYTAHLDDAQRLFVSALLLGKVKTWMRRQAGTSALRAVVYMDEIYGYFPPHPANPPTKRPLLTLLKQARAQGVGVVLATQNPVDLDYKGLANMGIWMVGRLQTEQDRARLRDGLQGAGLEAATIERLLDTTGRRVFLLHDVHRPEPCLLQTRHALSYLRGPLTRDEIERLRLQAPAAARPPTQGEETVESREGARPPILPSAWEHHYLKRYGGELADPYLLVKYSVRFKGAPESVAVRAYSLPPENIAEILEAEALPIDEGAVADETPADLRFGDLPEYFGSGTAREIEKTLKGRLADKLATRLLFDASSRLSSWPGEAPEAFAERVRSSPVLRSRRQKMENAIAKKRRSLAAREADLSGRRTEKWAAIGSAILSNIGLLGGRKRRLTGTGAVLSKNRMENTAEAKVEALKAEIAEMEEAIAALGDPSGFEERSVVPRRGDVKILRYDLLWVY